MNRQNSSSKIFIDPPCDGNEKEDRRNRVKMTLTSGPYEFWAYKLKTDDPGHLIVKPAIVGVLKPNTILNLKLHRLPKFDPLAKYGLLLERRDGPSIGVFGRTKNYRKVHVDFSKHSLAQLDEEGKDAWYAFGKAPTVGNEPTPKRTTSSHSVFVDRVDLSSASVLTRLQNSVDAEDGNEKEENAESLFDKDFINYCVLALFIFFTCSFLYLRQEDVYYSDGGG